jgi:hypothetical protein
MLVSCFIIRKFFRTGFSFAAVPFMVLALFLFTTHFASAQNLNPKKTLKGKIVTQEKNAVIPLEYATVRLFSLIDSSLIAGTTTDEFGDFIFNSLREKNFLFTVSCVGYQSINQHIVINEKEAVTQIKNISLIESAVALAEATVVAQRTEMTVKNDTVEYNAAAYKLRDNAVVEDLLKRLPGITITEDGKILVNGKEVKKVMVDGKDFFRSNPNLSIKNIPAEIMEKLQIIDDKSELAKLTGIDDGEESIAINITIQPGKKRGWLVSNNLGSGQELNGSEGNLLRYTVNSFAARLVEETQLGLIANGNNINGMNVGGGGSTIGSGKPGLNSSLSGGVNFSSGVEKEKEKYPWVMSGDLSYGFNENRVRRNSMRQYYLQDSTSYQTDSLEQYSREQGIRFSARMLNRSVKGWTFSFNPSASYNTVTRENSGYTLLQAGNAMRDSVNSNEYVRTSITPVIELRGIFTASHDFTKKGRKLSVSLDSHYSNSESEGETLAEYYYYKRSPQSRLVNRDQQWQNRTNSFVNRFYFSYIEPIAPKHFLQFAYWIQSNDRDNIKSSFKPDLLTGEYTVLDLPYSKSLENITLTQQLGVSYRGVLKKVVYTIGLDYNPSYIRSRSFIQHAAASGADSVISYFPGLRTFNYAPNAYLMYNIGKGKNLRFDYRGRSEAPSVYQLDPSRDETNPTNIRMGNPDLMPRFTHWSRLRYNDNNRKKQSSLSSNIEANYILNDIVNFTNYNDETGVKTTMPMNQSGSWNVTGMLMFNRPIGTHFQINNYSQVAMRNNIGFSSINSRTSSQKTVATTLSLKEEIGLTFKWDWFYAIAKANYQSGNTSYSVESMLPQSTSSMGGFLNAQATFTGSWVISTALNYRKLNGFSEAYNRDEMIWNAEISKSFLKNKKGTLTLIFNDILQQQLSINQIVSSNFVEDQQFNTLKSFVMLVFSYKFHTLGGKKS